MDVSIGFHTGELAVQRRAGVSAEAARLGGMLGLPDLSGGIGQFLVDRNLAATPCASTRPTATARTTSTGACSNPCHRSGAPGVRVAPTLSDADVDLVRAADTVLLGTTHPERGNDASHRGGPAGFVRVDGDGRLWIPDYPGNNMVNSLGNIAVDPSTALLFVDFASGATLQLTGTAELVFAATAVGDAGTGRAIRLTVDGVAAARPIPLRQAG